MNTCERIKQLFEDNRITPYEVSIRTHISQSTLSRIINNKTDKLSIKTTDILADYFSVRREWLVAGIGEKSVADAKTKANCTTEFLNSQSGYAVDPNIGIEQLKVMVMELKKKNDELTEDKRALIRSNELLALSLSECTKESLIKTEIIRTLSEGTTTKNGLDKAG